MVRAALTLAEPQLQRVVAKREAAAAGVNVDARTVVARLEADLERVVLVDAAIGHVQVKTSHTGTGLLEHGKVNQALEGGANFALEQMKWHANFTILTVGGSITYRSIAKHSPWQSTISHIWTSSHM